jgi:hypothetical protein
MLYREKIAVCSENHMKQTKDFLVSNLVVHKITTSYESYALQSQIEGWLWIGRDVEVLVPCIRWRTVPVSLTMEESWKMWKVLFFIADLRHNNITWTTEYDASSILLAENFGRDL